MEGLLAEIDKKKEELSTGSGKYLKRGDALRAKEEEEARRKDAAKKRKLDQASAESEERMSKLQKEVSFRQLA